MSTSGIDIVLAAFTTLAAEEQEEAFAKVSEARLRRLAGQEGETARHIRSLARIAAHVGRELSPDLYRQARRDLLAAGEEVIEFNAVCRYFGSWKQAKDALSLSAVSTPLKIEARFRVRLNGKVHRYREQTLRDTLVRCAADLGRAPLVIEFTKWREREHDLARARGEEVFLPSDSPYRRRWGTWERALLHFGFTPEAIAVRLEPSRKRSNQSLQRFRFSLMPQEVSSARAGQTAPGRRGGGAAA